MKVTTLCYIEKDEKYLMLHRTKKENDINKDKWIGVGGHAEGNESPEECLLREVKEETNLLTNNNIYLNWILEYESLGVQCKEYVYISFVKKDNIVLNEESIDYKWCTFDKFIKKVNWFGDKKTLKKVLNLAIQKQIFFKNEKIDKF